MKFPKIKTRHLLGAFLGVVGFLIVVSLSSCSSTHLTTTNSFQQDPIQYYLAAEVDSTVHQETAEYVVYQLEGTANASDFIRIDYYANNGVQNVFSSLYDKQGLWQIADSVPTMPNTDSAIKSSLYTVAELARQNPELKIRAILSTDGSSDKAVIASIAAVSDELLSSFSNYHLYIVGVSPENRATFSNGFSSIADRVQFASTRGEIDSVFRTF